MLQFSMSIAVSFGEGLEGSQKLGVLNTELSQKVALKLHVLSYFLDPFSSNVVLTSSAEIVGSGNGFEPRAAEVKRSIAAIAN